MEGGKGSWREGGTWQPPPPLPAASPGLRLRGGGSGGPAEPSCPARCCRRCVSTWRCAHPRALPTDGCIYSRGLHGALAQGDTAAPGGPSPTAEGVCASYCRTPGCQGCSRCPWVKSVKPGGPLGLGGLGIRERGCSSGSLHQPHQAQHWVYLLFPIASF